jgi:hypothetical protein
MLHNWFRSRRDGSKNNQKHRIGQSSSRWRFEVLEDRITPALVIDIVVGAAGSGTLDGFLGVNDGTITTADGGTMAGTVSTGTLATIGSTTSINISALDAINFNNLGGTFTLQTATGQSVSFSAGTGAISFTTVTNTLATSGASFSFMAGSNLTLANLNTAGGEVMLSAGNASAGNISAQGILTAGSGNLTFSATNASGGTISQVGAASGLATSISATGNIMLDSVRGSTVNVTSNTGSIMSLGTNAIQSTAQLTLLAETGINVRTLSPSIQATNNSSGNLTIVQNASPTQALTTVGSGIRNLSSTGTVSVTNLGSSITVAAASGITGSSDIFLAATDFDILGNVVAGGIATLANSTAGRTFDLGTNTAGTIGLTQTELDRVTGTVLRIGSATAGNINVSASITRTTSPLSLINNGTISDAMAGSITANSLRISSAGPVTLDSDNSVGTLASTTTGSLTFDNGTNPLSIGVVDGTTGITTTNAAATLIVDSLDIAQAINAGSGAMGGIVTISPNTAGRAIDLGTETGGKLSLTDTELDRVTARILRIGSTGAGSIDVSAAITLGTNVATLSLITADTVVDTGTGSLSVANLNVAATNNVTLDNNAANDVDSLSIAITASGADVVFGDVDGFIIDNVDTGSGISTSATAGSTVTLAAGSAVTQAMGANITTNELQLLGAGSYNLSNQGNNAVTLAASLSTATTGTLTYVDADALAIDVAVATTGITTNNSDVTVTSTNGALIVVNTANATDVAAGTGSIFLTAGSVGNDNAVAISAGAAVAGSGGIIVTADNISIGAGATINSDTGRTTLRPFEAATLIDLGGADAANTLGITSAEIDTITAGSIVVGRSSAGNISVTAAIAPANTNQLELVTGASILDANTVMNDITVARLALTAGTGIGVGDTLETAVSNVEATTTSGGIDLSNSGSLTIGGVTSALTGVSAGGGNISIVATGAGSVNDLTVSEAISNTGGGNITLTNLDADSAVTLAINATVSTTGGNGNILVNAEDDLNVTAMVSTSGTMMTPGTGTITLNADAPTNGTTDGTFVNSAAITSEAGSITILGAGVTISGGVSSTAGGAISITAATATGDVQVSAAVSSSGGNGNITLSSMDDVTIAAAVSTSNSMMTPGMGTITITADDSVSNGTGNFSNSGTGTISSQAGMITINGAATTIGASVTSTAGGAISASATSMTGDLMVNAGVTSSGGNGNITLSSMDDVTIAAAVTTSNSMTAGNGTVMVTADMGNSGAGDLSVTNVGSVSSQAGAITLAGVNTTIGGAVSSTAGGSITASSSTATGDLSVSSTGSIASSGGDGNIMLSSPDDITVSGAVSTSNSMMTPGTGTITITADMGTSGAGDFSNSMGGTLSTQGGMISISGAAVTIGAQVSSTAGGAISASATSTTGDLMVNAGVSSSGGNGNITLSSMDDVTIAAAVATSNSMMTAGNGTVMVTADMGNSGAGDLSVTNVGSVSSQAGAITLSGVNTTIGGAVSSTAGGSITASSSTATGDLSVSSTGSIASSGGDGNIMLSSPDDITISGAVSTSNSMMTPGTGTITITADMGTSGAGNFSNSMGGTISSQAGAISISGAATTIGAGVSSTGGGAISVSATEAASDLMVNAAITSSGGNGNITLSSMDDVTIAAAVTTSNSMTAGNGTVMVTADMGNSGAGNLSVTAAGSVSSQAGAITLSGVNTTIDGAVSSTAGGSITASSSTATGDLSVSSTGSIASSGGNGNIMLSSPNDIMISGAVSTSNSMMTPGTGTITITADMGTSGMGNFSNSGSGTISSQAGMITINGAATTIGASVTSTAGGAISLAATAAANDLAVNAAVSSTAGNGNISLTSLNNVSITDTVSTSNSMMTPGTGTITATTGGTFSNTSTGMLSTQNGTILVTSPTSMVGGGISASGTGNVTFSAGLSSGTTFTNQAAISSGNGNVTIRYDSQDLQSGSTITVASNREVNLRANTNGVGVDLGSMMAGLNFTQGELSTITGGQLRITSTANTTFSQSIDLSSQVQTLVLQAVGGIIDGTATEQTDLTVNRVAFDVRTGIGAADDINLAVSNLAFRNVTSGAVNITNVGALTVASVFDVTTSTNSATGAGNTTTISASSPMTFAVNTMTTGDTTYTAGETNDPGTFADDLTVNMGVTVSVSAGDLTLRAGDDIILNSGSTVSASGALTITAGFNDLDGSGGLVLNGTISGDPLSLSAVDDIVVGVITGGTVTITSSAGSILDGNDDMTVGTLNITATDLTLSAFQGIGVINGMNPTITAAQAPLEVSVTNLVLTNTGMGATGDISVVDTTGGVSVEANNAAMGGAINITTLNGGTLTVTANDIVTTNGEITLTTDDIAFAMGAVVDAGTAGINLVQQTDSFGFIVGTTGMNALLVADAELDNLTAAVVRLGRTTATGDFLVDQAITTPAGFDDLTIRSGGTVSQSTGATITVGTMGAGDLAIESVGTVTLTEANSVANLAASVTGMGSSFSFTDANALVIGSVDGVNGVSTNNGNVTVGTVAGDLTISDTLAMADVSAGSGTISLVAGNLVTNTLTNSAGASVNTSGNIFIIADNVTLATTSSISTTGVVRIRPNTGVAIDVGGADMAGMTPVLGLTSAELNTITAGVLGIGEAGTSVADSGAITVTAAITPTGTSVLVLLSGSGITQATGATITETGLRLQAGAAILLNQANDVDTLSAAVSGMGTGFTFVDADDLAIGTVAGQSGVTTVGGNVNISTTLGNLTVNQGINAGAATIDLTAGGANSTFTNNAAISNTMANSIDVTADRFALAGGTIATGSGRVRLDAFSSGRLFDLGSTTDVAANTAELSDAELDAITTTGVLQIGNSTAGNFTVSAAIDSVNVSTLSLVTNAGVTGTGGITEANVSISAGSAVSLTGANEIDTLAASVAGMGNGFTLNNGTALTIGTVDGLSGLTTLDGVITVTNTGDVSVMQDVNAGAAAVNLSAGGMNGTLTNAADITGNAATLSADRIDLQMGSTVNAGTGIATLSNVTAGRLIDLGSMTDTAMNTLEISDAELDRVTAGVIRVGSTTAGNLSATAAISPMNASTLSLLTGGTVSQTAPITVTNLRVASGGSATLTNAANNVSTLAASVTGPSNSFSYTDADFLFIDMVDTTDGIDAPGTVNLTATVSNLNLTSSVTGGGAVTLTAAGGGGIVATSAQVAGLGVTITADSVILLDTVDGGSGIVTIAQATNGRVVNLGNTGTSTMSLDLSAAELALISGSLLRIGNANTGAISVTAAVATPNVMGGLSLRTGAGVNQATGATITTSDLAISAGATVNLTQNNDVIGDFAAIVTGMGSQLNFTNANAVTIGTVDGVDGVNSSGTVTLNGTSIVANQNVTGSGAVQLTATEGMGTTNVVNVASGVEVRSTAGNVLLQGGDGVTIAGDVFATSTGNGVVIDLGLGDNDGTSTGLIGGMISSTMPVQINGSAAGGSSLTINTATADILGGGAVFNGVGMNNTLILDGSAETTAQTFDLNASTGVLDVDLSSNVTINANVQTVNATTGTGNDTFNVTPGTTTAINVLSGSGTDTLNLDLTGVTGTALTLNGAGIASGGTYTFTNRASVTFSGIETTDPALVSIAVTDASGAETGVEQPANGISFTLTRAGNITGALTVNYTVSGTATNGLDFQTLGGTVTFPAGSATATINVNVLNDSMIEDPESITITLASGTGYLFIAGATSTATATINDNDVEFKRVVASVNVGGTIRVFDNGSETPTFSINPYAGFTGGVAVAVGDVNGDGIGDFATVVTSNGPSHVKVFDGATGAERLSFITFAGYSGGANIALGDLNGDGRAEIIIGANQSATHVRVFDGMTGGELASFFAYPLASGPGTTAALGVSVGVVDTNGDGVFEILTGARTTGNPHVKTFDLAGNTLRSFFAFDTSLTGGITVAGGDLDGDGLDDIVAGVNLGATGTQVRIFNGDNSIRATLPLPPSATLTPSPVGPSVAVGDADGDGDLDLIVTLGANVAVFDGATLASIDIANPFTGFQGGVFVGA